MCGLAEVASRASTSWSKFTLSFAVHLLASLLANVSKTNRHSCTFPHGTGAVVKTTWILSMFAFILSIASTSIFGIALGLASFVLCQCIVMTQLSKCALITTAILSIATAVVQAIAAAVFISAYHDCEEVVEVEAQVEEYGFGDDMFGITERDCRKIDSFGIVAALACVLWFVTGVAAFFVPPATEVDAVPAMRVSARDKDVELPVVQAEQA